MSDKFIFTKIDGRQTAPGSLQNTPATVFQSTPYHKRQSERLIYDLIFDAFIAPVIAVLRACTALFFNILLLFGLTYGSIHCLARISQLINVEEIYSNYRFDITLVLAIFGTAIILFFYCWLIIEQPSKLFGTFNGASSALMAAAGLLMKFETPNSIGIFAAFGACISALIYWIWIETNQKTLSSLLSHHYGQVSNLKLS
uniref:Uncharacterized protein n=1 Tax=Panagrolaimus sp. ES5 TaxID=591445 RepID=A0AC34FJW8_9BILA